MINIEINELFNKKIAQLEKELPNLEKKIGHSCAALTLTNILDVLGLDGFNNHYYNNFAVPFSGFGSYTSKKGWKGPCGAVSGALAAIGIIMGGKEKIRSNDMMSVYMKAIKFASAFEIQFGSVSCSEICGIDLGQPAGIEKYIKNQIWTKKCQHFVIFAIDQVRKLTGKQLNKKWN